MTLKIVDQEYFDKVVEFAKQAGLEDQLQKRLDFLDTYAEHGDRNKTQCQLFRDFAPYSFYFVMCRRQENGEYLRWFNGGVIFHGPHDNGGDGSYPTLSVSVDPCHGWQVHT